MKYLKYIMFGIIMAAMWFGIGCCDERGMEPRQLPPGRYMVYAGGPFGAVGYPTDEYEKVNGMVQFVNKINGKKYSIPVNQIWRIETD